MKIPFRRTDPAEALKTAQQALATTEAKILDLGQARGAKLLETDGIDEVTAIDRQIEQQRQAAVIHRDRIAVLQGEVRRLEAEASAKRHGERVATTAKALAERNVTAGELQAAIQNMAVAYFKLIDQNREIARQWGMSVNAVRTGALDIGTVSREVSWALFAAGRPHGGKCHLPSPSNAGLGVAGDTGGGNFAERVSSASAALLDMIRAAPEPLPEREAA